MAGISSQGTQLAISTGLGTALATPTAISKATQCVVTVTNTLAKGDSVNITGVSGMTQLNGDYTVVAATGTTITLDVDSTNFSTWTSGGSIKPHQWVSGCNVTNIGGVGSGSAADIETSTLCSVAKEYLVGLQDNGEASFDGYYQYAGSDLFWDEAYKARAKGTMKRFKVTFPSTTNFMVFNGFVKTMPVELAVDAAITQQMTVKLSGQVSLI